MTVKYKSKMEQRVGAKLGRSWEYEPKRYPYTMERNYVPDFVKDKTWIEVKGFFRVGDVAKYKAIRASNPHNRLIFVFSDPKKKVRKGSKINMGEWATKNGWEFTTIDTLIEVLNGNIQNK